MVPLANVGDGAAVVANVTVDEHTLEWGYFSFRGSEVGRGIDLRPGETRALGIYAYPLGIPFRGPDAHRVHINLAGYPDVAVYASAPSR